MKIQQLQAYSFPLSEGVQAVLVQAGPTWNGMAELRCIAPAAFKEERMIVMAHGAAATRHFNLLLGDSYEDFIVVMATPKLREVLTAIGAIPKPDKAEGTAA